MGLAGRDRPAPRRRRQRAWLSVACLLVGCAPAFLLLPETATARSLCPAGHYENIREPRQGVEVGGGDDFTLWRQLTGSRERDERSPAVRGVSAGRTLRGSPGEMTVELALQGRALRVRLLDGSGRQLAVRRYRVDHQAGGLVLPSRLQMGGDFPLWGLSHRRAALWRDAQGRLLATNSIGGVTFLAVLPLGAASGIQVFQVYPESQSTIRKTTTRCPSTVPVEARRRNRLRFVQERARPEPNTGGVAELRRGFGRGRKPLRTSTDS
ncbi:MAG: hypothetical protein OXT09_24790 [Myxococcales bacterium]|nr:hypothetical protein [Myxococcales bacterium]